MLVPVYSTSTITSRLLIGPFPLYMILFKLLIGKHNPSWNVNANIWFCGCIAVIGLAIVFSASIFLSFGIDFFGLNWFYGALFNWVFFLFLYLYIYGSKTVGFIDTLIFVSLSLRAMGEVWEVPSYFHSVLQYKPSILAVVSGTTRFVAVSFGIGLYCVLFLYLLSKVAVWKKPRFFNAIFLGMLATFPLTYFLIPYNPKLVSLLARFVWGLFFAYYGVGFKDGIKL